MRQVIPARTCLAVLFLGTLAAAAAAAPGSRLWLTRYNGPGNGSDAASDVAWSPDGSKVFVTGYSTGATSVHDFATVAYNASTGAQIWAKRFNRSANGDDEASELAVSPDGTRVFVSGSSTGTTTSEDYTTIAYDAATGAQLWISYYNGVGNASDDVKAIAVSSTAVFVTGYSVGSTSSRDYATVAYNAATGARLWVKRYNGVGNADDTARGVAVSHDGTHVFVTGGSAGTGDDFLTIAYAASDGAQQWVRRYNGPGDSDDGATALAVSADDTKVLVTGHRTGTAGFYDFATIAYSAASGTPLWTRGYDGLGASIDDAVSLAVSADGNVFITGTSGGTTTNFDYATIAYDSAGTRLWVKRHNGPGPDYPSGVAVSPDGATVFVTGQSMGSVAGDFLTFAYDSATGAQLWFKRYDGLNGTDGPGWLAVSPDGARIAVTGWSPGATSGDDYATLVYATQ